MCRKHKTILVIDEAFIDFHAERDNITMINEAINNNYLIVVRSLTKIYALAGLRLGYLVGADKMLKRIAKVQHPWNINTMAQVVGKHVLKEREYHKQTIKVINKERAYLTNNLNKINGLKVFPSDVNFILCKIDKALFCDVDVLQKKLLKKNILIRNCKNFRGLNKHFFRIAVRLHKENLQLIEGIEHIAKETKIKY